MRSFLPALAACVLALAAGCSSDSTSPDNNPPPPVSQVILGPDGGAWRHEGFQLDVPPGQLPDGTTLRLYAEDAGTAAPRSPVSAVYRIEGIPLGLGRDFRLRLAHGAAGGDSLFVLFGQRGYVPSLNRTELGWRMVACTDSSGWAICDLPVAGPPAAVKDAPPALHVTVVAGVATAASGGGRFLIHWQPAQILDEDIAALARQLENALDLYEFLGYAQAGFTGWPVEVQVAQLPYNGVWHPDPRRLGGHLALAVDAVAHGYEMPMTVGHELMHFCQYFYDPRSVHERGTVGPAHVWFNEATAVHMEIYFAPDDGYPSSSRIGHELTLLDGLLTPAGGRDLATHGYGVSSLVRHLARVEPGADNFIVDVYEAIAQGTHAAAALQAATTTDISGQWQTVLEDLVRGDIYPDVTWPVLEARPLPALLTARSAADTAGTVVRDLSDLSGLAASVTLNRSDWTSVHRLVFWTEQVDCGVSVLGVKADGTRDLLGRGAGRVALSDPAMLQNLYEQLLVLAANRRFQGPGYDETRQVTLQARVRAPEAQPVYPRLSFHLQCDILWDDASTTVDHLMNIWNADGRFAGGLFTAAWDSTIDDGAVRFTGQLTATVDPEFRWVSSWSARNEIRYSDGTGVVYAASGGLAPATGQTVQRFTAAVEGTATCGILDSVSMTHTTTAGTRTRVDHGCRGTSFVRFVFENPLGGGR